MSFFYVVSTPIGNLKDITLRAIEVLENVDFILCEDTRVCSKLFNLLKLNIKSKSIYSFHKFNESKKIQIIYENLNSGHTYALVSDAGTPTISDPGQKLISYLLEQKIQVVPIGGVCSPILALSASGLIYDKFTFIGFLAQKESGIKKQLSKLGNELIIAFESPHRILKTLNILQLLFGNINLTIARELTKKFETIETNSIEEWKKKIIPKGEFVLIFKK